MRPIDAPVPAQVADPGPAVLNDPELTAKSKAQLKQDLFALAETGFKRGRYFVEFGATDEVTLGNSYPLGKEFGWQGVLAEPGGPGGPRWTATETCRSIIAASAPGSGQN